MAFLFQNHPFRFKTINVYPQGLLYVLIWKFCTLAGFMPEVAAAPSPANNQFAQTSVSTTTGKACSANIGLQPQISELASTALLMSTWISKPTLGVQSFVEAVSPYVFAFVNRSAWPNIHERARMAKVPVLMYHDILPQKEVFFDVTPDELEQHFRLLQEQGVNPINLDQLMTHLQTGMPLPEKPVVLTFDDGYGGHYEYVYPLLKKYGFPAVFSIYTNGVGNNVGRSHVSWEQLREMAANPLVTIASHSVTHPNDLTKLPDEQLIKELVESKNLLESNLGVKIRYFTYPVGKYDARVAQRAYSAGYELALTMDENDSDERFAGESESLLAVARFGQSRIAEVITQAWGGSQLPRWNVAFDFTSPVQKTKTTIDNTPLILISGGKPITIHADSRYQLEEVVAKSGTNAIAAVDGGFFSLKYLNSNVMIGPVLSQVTNQFIPGNINDNKRIIGRPLVLISPHTVRFIPFDYQKHNTLAGIKAEMPDVTDAFVAAAWLVRNGEPQSPSSFNSLFDFDAARHRAFWGVTPEGKPTIGVSETLVDSVSLGKALTKAGLQDVVMLDSGASTSLVYEGESLVGYIPRPVPHAVALIPPLSASSNVCPLVVGRESKTPNN
jgi:biofilm PGA synthesis lipoprotein PgaB